MIPIIDGGGMICRLVCRFESDHVFKPYEKQQIAAESAVRIAGSCMKKKFRVR
jgi:hypothetical protein